MPPLADMVDSMAFDVTQLPTSGRRGRPTIAHVAETDRQHAFARAKRHSALVRVLKAALPVIAVMSTGALFLSPTMLVRFFQPGINASVGAVEVTTDQLRMINPRFDGFTADKGHYVVAAKAAVQMLNNTDLMQLESVHGHLVQLDKSWTDLTSTAGTYQTKTKALHLAQGIIITTSADARVELDHADVDVDKKAVTSDADVAMTMPNGTLKGRGLLVDNAARRLLVSQAVRAHLLTPKRTAVAAPATTAAVPTGALSIAPVMSDAPVDITSSQLEILDNAKTATFSGAVRAIQAGMTLRSERMEVGYSGAPGAATANLTSAGASAQNLSYVTASNAVVITTPDGRKATCDQSRFDQKANTMTLLGSVVLSQKSSELHADSVVYDMTTKKTHATAKNRVSGHFEPDALEAAGQRPAANPAPAALAGLGSSQGETDISADRLDIASAENLAVFEGRVIVSQRGNKLTGDRLAIDMVKHHMSMTGQGRVSGVFDASNAIEGAPQVSKAVSVRAGSAAPGIGHSLVGLSANSGGPTNIESDSLSVEDDRGQATFTGNVVVVRGGHRISAEQLTVDYGRGGATAPGGSQLKRIQAKDHVVVHTPDNQVATSDWLLYDPLHSRLTMGGNVTVSQGPNVVRGEKLVVDLATGESHFETRADEATASLPAATTSPGRIQVLITPQGIQQIGGPPVAKTPVAAKPKQDMSASDVMVAPSSPQ